VSKTRIASQISDPRHWSHAGALLGFLPGIPCVYYGGEFGLEAVKEQRPSDDDVVRPEMPKERWLFTHSHPEVEQALGGCSGCVAATHGWSTR